MKRYSKDYDTVTIKDEKGRDKFVAVYKGDYFETTLDEEAYARFRRNCFLLLAAVVILQFGSGFVDNQGMYQFYVALPYVLVFFPLVYLAEGVLRLPKEKRKYRRDETELSFDRIKKASRILMIVLGLGVLGEIVFLLFNSAGRQSLQEYAYLGLEFLAAGGVYLLIKLQKQIQVQISSEK